MATPNDELRIWQWNCRSFAHKKASLQQYLRSHEAKPHVILLQETAVPTDTFSGYQWIPGPSGGRGTATLVANKITCIAHSLDEPEIEHVIVEIIPGNTSRQSVYILNVYSSPSHHRQRFTRLFQKAIRLAESNPLVIAGDFNAAHRAWGYAYDTPKGNELWQNANDMDLVLITDKAFPTRTGTSTQRDTTPDLCFVKNIADARWSNLAVDLGSDHFLLAVHLPTVCKKTKLYTWVDWDLFRKTRAERHPPDAAPSLETWTAQLKVDVDKATKTITTDLPTEKMDSRLAHLLEAKQSLLARWKGQRLNRRLRKRISELNKNMEDHCRALSKQKWDEVCNSIDGQVRNGKSWNLLKHLLDDTNTRTNQRHSLAKILHQAKRTAPPEDVTKTLVQKYLPLPTGPSTPHPEYLGTDNTQLDADFSVEEVRRALHELNGRSAPGPDGITNKLLRNLDDPSVTYLTDTINEIWKKGELPDAWKLAHTILIPKPGKAPSLDHLRPISLTSCVAKVAEHVVLNRVGRYLEDHDCLPHHMIGFRSGLSTQDAMLLLKHQILDGGNTQDTRAILGLDLEKAFDNITHSSILKAIANLGLGRRFYDFVRSFLTGRRAVLCAGDLVSEEVELGQRGTPQGSVLSPTLFNLVMIGLSEQLSKIEGLNHTIYADDVTIWCSTGSDGFIESTLQEAIETTESYLEHTGLKCSPAKSELLIYLPKRRGAKPKGWQPPAERNIILHTRDGRAVPRVDSIRVLGMIIECRGTNTQTVQKLKTRTDNAIRLVRRVANRHHGLKEDNLMRLVHAFVLCHFTYVAAMHKWLRTERDKLNALIRKVVKRALGLPMSTSTEKLLELGVHNTLEEIAEAQERAQLLRLRTTKAGRHILHELGFSSTAGDPPEWTPVPREIRDLITINPIPRNVHPDYNRGRRLARATAFLKRIDVKADDVSFVDAAAYRNNRAFAAVAVSSTQRILNSATILTRDPEVAEQVAIALSVLDSKREVIYSDSRAAMKAFERGVVSDQALRILRSVDPSTLKHHTVIWFPAHLGRVPGAPSNLNEIAHDAARALTDRAVTGKPHLAELEANRDAPITYNDITKHFYLGRRIFPPPHPKLNRPQALTLRLLQTHTYPNLAKLHVFYPDAYPSDTCPSCGHTATLTHMLWECRNAHPGSTSHKWETSLRSSLLADQQWAVQQAHEAAARYSLSVPTWETPATR